MSLHVPVISVALEWETKLWKNQGKQHRHVNGEIKSTKSDVSLEFSHFEQEKQDEETQATDDSCKAGGRCDGCEDGGVKELQGKSRHHHNSDNDSDLNKERALDQNEVCSGRSHKSEDLKQNYPDVMMANVDGKCSKEAECDEREESVSSEAVYETTQKVTARILNFSSNVKIFGKYSTLLVERNLTIETKYKDACIFRTSI